MGYTFGQGYSVEVEINGKFYPVSISKNKAPIFEEIQRTASAVKDDDDEESVRIMEDLVLEALDELLGKEAMDEILNGVVEEDKNLLNYVGLAQYILKTIGDVKPDTTQKVNRATRRRTK